MTVICKKCLVGQQAEDYRNMLQRSKAAIPQRDRASDAVYAGRIQACEACDQLVSATCQACGCYVELRALRANARCPRKKW